MLQLKISPLTVGMVRKAFRLIAGLEVSGMFPFAEESQNMCHREGLQAE
jgi:hypothetical protein